MSGLPWGDEAGPYLAEQMNDPAFADAYRVATALHEVVDELVAARQAAGLSQRMVADLMGSTQPTVSRLEQAAQNPSLRTLVRYAHAVGGRLRITVDRDPPNPAP